MAVPCCGPRASLPCSAGRLCKIPKRAHHSRPDCTMLRGCIGRWVERNAGTLLVACGACTCARGHDLPTRLVVDPPATHRSSWTSRSRSCSPSTTSYGGTPQTTGTCRRTRTRHAQPPCALVMRTCWAEYALCSHGLMPAHSHAHTCRMNHPPREPSTGAPSCSQCTHWWTKSRQSQCAWRP